MKHCVVDASTVAAAFFQEKHAESAQILLASDCRLDAPDLISAEFANVVWKRRMRGDIDEQEATELLLDFLRLPLRTTPSADLAESALQLAPHTRRTVYDCPYLALAVSTASVPGTPAMGGIHTRIGKADV